MNGEWLRDLNMHRSMGWAAGGLIDSWADWWIGRMIIDSVIDALTESLWFVDCSVRWFIVWRIRWLIHWLVDSSIHWLRGWVVDLFIRWWVGRFSWIGLKSQLQRIEWEYMPTNLSKWSCELGWIQFNRDGGGIIFALMDRGRIEFGKKPFQLDWLRFEKARKMATRPSDDRWPFTG